MALSGRDPALVPALPAQEAVRSELSFPRVYQDNFDFVWRSLRRLGVAREQADDAVQDVFVIAYRRAPDFEGRSSVRTWLFSIAVRVASDARRRERRKGGLVQLSPSLPAKTASPQQQVETSELVAFVERFLNTLDDDQRAVFVLAELEQMSAEEIADATDAGLNTVYSRLRLARQHFKRALSEFQGAKS